MNELLNKVEVITTGDTIEHLLLPSKMTIAELAHILKVDHATIFNIFEFKSIGDNITYEDAAEIAGELGIPTREKVVSLPPTLSINHMAKLCGITTDAIANVFAYKKASDEIRYGQAKEIAWTLGIRTKKVLKHADFYDVNMKLFEDYHKMSILHEFNEHNPEFDMIDTSMIPVFLMQSDAEGQANDMQTYGQIYKVKADPTNKKRDMFTATEQMDNHLTRMAKRLEMDKSELEIKLKKNARPINHSYDFSLIDTSDIAIFLKKGEADKTWYADNYQHLLKEKAEDDDIDILIEFLAATSIRTHLKGNVKKALKEYDIYKKWLAKGDPEAPIKWDTQFHAVKVQLDNIKKGKNLGGRKIHNFAQAMKGDPEAVVVDMWIMRAYKMGDGRSPSRVQYDQIENHIKLIAKEIGWQPREVCSAIWGGIRAPFDGETRYEKVISKHKNGNNGNGDHHKPLTLFGDEE